MEIGQPVTDDNRYGVVEAFGPKGADGDCLVTVKWESGTKGFAWRSAFQATGLRIASGMVWRLP